MQRAQGTVCHTSTWSHVSQDMPKPWAGADGKGIPAAGDSQGMGTQESSQKGSSPGDSQLVPELPPKCTRMEETQPLSPAGVQGCWGFIPCPYPCRSLSASWMHSLARLGVPKRLYSHCHGLQELLSQRFPCLAPHPTRHTLNTKFILNTASTHKPSSICLCLPCFALSNPKDTDKCGKFEALILGASHKHPCTQPLYSQEFPPHCANIDFVPAQCSLGVPLISVTLSRFQPPAASSVTPQCFQGPGRVCKPGTTVPQTWEHIP